MIIFYGGKNSIDLVEYNSIYFSNISNFLEKKIKKYNIKDIDNNLDHINLKEFDHMCRIIIPNYMNNYLIKIKPYSHFDINKIIDPKHESTKLLMIILNYNYHNNLELIVKKENNIGYFYNLTKKTSITSLFDIYNNSNVEINIIVFIIKKPYWYY